MNEIVKTERVQDINKMLDILDKFIDGVGLEQLTDAFKKADWDVQFTRLLVSQYLTSLSELEEAPMSLVVTSHMSTPISINYFNFINFLMDFEELAGLMDYSLPNEFGNRGFIDLNKCIYVACGKTSNFDEEKIMKWLEQTPRAFNTRKRTKKTNKKTSNETNTSQDSKHNSWEDIS